MLSLSFIRNNRDLIIERLDKRNFNSKALVDKIIKLDIERRKIIAVLEEKQAKGNFIAKKIGEFYKSAKTYEAENLKKESTDV
jgi:seryl-tRNA synthetase